MASCIRFAVTSRVKMRRGHGAGVNRDCEDAATSESFELPAVAASPGPAEGALATAMAKSPAARSEPITAFALIQRLNSRGSSEDQSRKMSRFSTTRLRLLRRPLIASRPAGEGEVVHRAERNKVQDRQTSGPKAGARSSCHRPPSEEARELLAPGKGHRFHLGDRVRLETSAWRTEHFVPLAPRDCQF